MKKMIAAAAVMTAGSAMLLAPNIGHADTWHVSLNLAPQPAYYAQPVHYVAPRPVVVVNPAPVYYSTYYAPRPVVVNRVVYRPAPHRDHDRYDRHDHGRGRGHDNHRGRF